MQIFSVSKLVQVGRIALAKPVFDDFVQRDEGFEQQSELVIRGNVAVSIVQLLGFSVTSFNSSFVFSHRAKM